MKKSGSLLIYLFMTVGVFFLWLGSQMITSGATKDWPTYLKVAPFIAAVIAIFWPLIIILFPKKRKGFYLPSDWSQYAFPQTAIPYAMSKGQSWKEEEKLLRKLM